MKSDSKIVLIIIACFIVIGIYNYSASGVFLTPFFLNYFIFPLVAIWFFAKYRGAILGVYLIGILSISLSHYMMLETLISQIFKIESLYNFRIDPYHKLLGVALYFFALIYIEISRLHPVRHKLVNWFPTIILLLSFVFTLGNFGYWQAISLSVYMISYLISLRQPYFENKNQFRSIWLPIITLFNP